MQKFADTIFSQPDPVTGYCKPLQYARVYVYQAGSPNLAVLYADDETTKLNNPLITNSAGFYQCKLSNGAYDVAIEFGGVMIPVKGNVAFDGSQATVSIQMPPQYVVTNGNAVTWQKQKAKQFLAGPVSGVDALPVFREVSSSDLPFTGTPSADSYLAGDFSWKPGITRMLLQEQQASGISGGTFTAGAWRTRTLNTSVFNSVVGASLSTNQITLPAGSYMLEATAPAFFVEHHKARLQNITDGTTTQLGTSEYSGASGNGCTTTSRVTALFTIAATKTFELQHYAAATRGTDGYGRANSTLGTTEVFSSVLITKLS